MTNAERKFLHRYRSFRDNPPSAGAIAKKSIPLFVILALYAAATAYADIGTELTWFVIGVATGAIGRQIAYIIYASRMSSILFQVIDWNRVDELLRDDVTES